MDEHRSPLRRLTVPALGAVFLLLSLSLALMAGNVYQRVAADSDMNYARRTGLSYISNQLRRADIPGGVSLGSFGGGDAIIIRTEPDYVTYIYCSGGFLRELYTDPADGLEPEDGTELLPAASLSAEYKDGGLALELDGRAVFLRLRCNTGEAEP
ncbi:MAG: DUF4860 domain-containing protein [Candidatus Heteroscillospira sp.]|jgi:hypothetical protein